MYTVYIHYKVPTPKKSPDAIFSPATGDPTAAETPDESSGDARWADIFP